MSELSQVDSEHFRAVLLERQDQLSRELRDGQQLLSNEDRYVELAGEVADSGDASVAVEQADLRSAEIERDIGEMNAIEAALGRLDDDSYGTCIDRGEDIPLARLKANPTASRCIRCQTIYESQYAGQETPSL